MMPLEEFQPDALPDCSGVYLLSESRSRKLYAGETMNLRRRLTLQFGKKQRAAWSRISETLLIQVLRWTHRRPASSHGRAAWSGNSRSALG
jgi:excinuclease UvrABC nuclease subunit